MIQVTAMNSAKPAASGMDVLAGMSGETQDSSGFEGVLSTQMESAAPAGPSAGDALRLASGKAAGKATGKLPGKILPPGLPEGQELPSGKDKAAADLLALPADVETPAGDNAADPSLLANQIVVVVAPVTAQAAVEMEVSSGDGQPRQGLRPSLPRAEAKSASQVPAAVLPQLLSAKQAAASSAPGQEVKAALPAGVPVLVTPLGNVPIQLGHAAGGAGQSTLADQAPTAQALSTQAGSTQAGSTQAGSTQVLSVQDLSTQGMTVRAVAASPLALSGETVRLHPVAVKADQAIKETPAAKPIEAAASASVPAEGTAPLLPTPPGEEAVPTTTSTPARQMARIAGMSAKEGLDQPQLLKLAEGGQTTQSWFGSMAQARSDAALPAGQIAPGQPAERPQDFAALVDRLVAAREFAMPTPVYAAINHAEFGQVSLKFEHGDHGLSVAVSSPDPDFARAVQAAAPSAGQSAMQDSRDGSAAGHQPAAARQDTLAQSFGGGTQPHSRNTDGGDRQSGEIRQFRREAPASSQAETDKPRPDGIFA